MIDFIPCVTLQDVSVAAKTHPAADDDVSFANLWSQSFLEQEAKVILAEGPGESVAPVCLQIMKAIRRNFPFQLGLFNEYIYKCCLLQVPNSETNWCQEALPERFVDVFTVLESSFRTHSLPHYLCRGLNLIQHFNVSLLGFLAQSIAEVLHDANYNGLLQVHQ